MLTAEKYVQNVESLFNHFYAIGVNNFIKLISDISADEKGYLNINQRNLELLDKFAKNLNENKNSLRFTRTILYKLISVGDPDINENFDNIQYLISSLDTTKQDFKDKLAYYDNILYIIESLVEFKDKINYLSKMKRDYDVELNVYSKLKYLENVNDVLKVVFISDELFDMFVELKFKYKVLLEELNSLIAVKDDILEMKEKVKVI